METIVRAVLSTVTKKLDVRNRTITFVGTKESPDRTGDIIRVEGWEFDNFQKNPVFLWNHDPSIPPIGKIKRIEILGKEVMFDVEFAPASVNEFADTVFKLFEAGFLSAVSVGFIPKDIEFVRDMNDMIVGLDIRRQELLELSAVAIPAHADALAASAFKKLKDQESKLPHSSDTKEKAVSLDEYRKTLPTPEHEETTMTEQQLKEFAELKEAVAQLTKDLASTITLRESVDLSVKTMETLNKAVLALLEMKKGTQTDDEGAAPSNGVVSKTSAPLDLTKLMDSLGTVVQKINDSAKFQVKGDK